MAVICDIINYLSISIISSDNSILLRLFKNTPIDADSHLMNNNISHFCPNSNNTYNTSGQQIWNGKPTNSSDHRTPHTTVQLCDDGQYAKLKTANVFAWTSNNLCGSIGITWLLAFYYDCYSWCKSVIKHNKCVCVCMSCIDQWCKCREWSQLAK